MRNLIESRLAAFASQEGDPGFRFVFRNPRAYWRIGAFGHIGLLESYFDGDLDVEGSLALALASGMQGRFDRPMPFVWIRNQWHELRFGHGDWRQAKENANFHYALGHDFYRLWPDADLLMYTCGYWREGTRTVEEAQRNKVEHVCRKVQLKPGETVIDIGSGFGGFMFHAQRFHCSRV